jgi:hypothetical protein
MLFVVPQRFSVPLRCGDGSINLNTDADKVFLKGQPAPGRIPAIQTPLHETVVSHPSSEGPAFCGKPVTESMYQKNRL